MSSPISHTPSVFSALSGGSGSATSSPVGGANPASLLPFGDLLANQQALLQQLLAAGEDGGLAAELGALLQQSSDGDVDLEALVEELEAAVPPGSLLPQGGKMLPLTAEATEPSAGEAAAVGGVAAALFAWRTMLSDSSADVGPGDAQGTRSPKLVAATVALPGAQPDAAGLTPSADSGDNDTGAWLMAGRSPLQPPAGEVSRSEFAALATAVSADAADGGDSRSALTDISRLATARNAPDVRSSPLQLTISQHAVDDPAWSQAVGARIHWMAGNGVQNATLRLNPEELGGINVQLTTQGDRTAVQFQTQHQDTCDLIEKMLPRLNQSMEQQGMRLDEVKVSHQASWGEANQQQAQQQSQQPSGRSGQGFAQLHPASAGTDDDVVSTPTPAPSRGDGSVDAYA